MKDIECWKAICYRDFVPAGLPKEECNKQYDYLSCVYWHGQYLVFLDILAAPLKAILNMIANPIASAWMASKFGLNKACVATTTLNCDGLTSLCTASWNFWCGAWAVMNAVESAAQIWQMVQSMLHFEWDEEKGYCDKLIDR
jgi:hypothetical protein